MKPGDFVTSDHHFGHSNVIKFCKRPFWQDAAPEGHNFDRQMCGPFPNVREMDEFLIEAWNKKVPKDGVVYYLGDFGFINQDRIITILKQLNGKIRFVRGNHDRNFKGRALSHVEWIKDYYETFTPDGIRVVMCHYPMMSWNDAYKGSYHLHGHCHNTLGKQTKRIVDVGVDCNKDYSPFSYEDICKIMSKRDKLGAFEKDLNIHDLKK